LTADHADCRTQGDPIGWNLEILDINGGGRREILKLTRPDGRIGTPNWSPDGRRIAFDAGDGRNEYWALENFLPSARAAR
ncbi:MAG: hypothetical protein AAB225_30900, partial [Acidobacteriota bacterium]